MLSVDGEEVIFVCLEGICILGNDKMMHNDMRIAKFGIPC